MSRKDEIIAELEFEFGTELDSNFDPGVNGLCDDTHCRHAECSCWSSFESAVRTQLKQDITEIEGDREWDRFKDECHEKGIDPHARMAEILRH